MEGKSYPIFIVALVSFDFLRSITNGSYKRGFSRFTIKEGIGGIF